MCEQIWCERCGFAKGHLSIIAKINNIGIFRTILERILCIRSNYRLEFTGKDRSQLKLYATCSKGNFLYEISFDATIFDYYYCRDDNLSFNISHQHLCHMIEWLKYNLHNEPIVICLDGIHMSNLYCNYVGNCGENYPTKHGLWINKSDDVAIPNMDQINLAYDNCDVIPKEYFKNLCDNFNQMPIIYRTVSYDIQTSNDHILVLYFDSSQSLSSCQIPNLLNLQELFLFYSQIKTERDYVMLFSNKEKISHMQMILTNQITINVHPITSDKICLANNLTTITGSDLSMDMEIVQIHAHKRKNSPEIYKKISRMRTI